MYATALQHKRRQLARLLRRYREEGDTQMVNLMLNKCVSEGTCTEAEAAPIRAWASSTKFYKAALNRSTREYSTQRREPVSVAVVVLDATTKKKRRKK